MRAMAMAMGRNSGVRAVIARSAVLATCLMMLTAGCGDSGVGECIDEDGDGYGEGDGCTDTDKRNWRLSWR